jgi:hypothetical protein
MQTVLFNFIHSGFNASGMSGPLHTVVVGDVLLVRNLSEDAIRISAEVPVPILLLKDEYILRSWYD